MTHCEMQTKTVKERLIKHNIKCFVVQKKNWTTVYSKSEHRTIKHPCHATRGSNDETNETAL